MFNLNCPICKRTLEPLSICRANLRGRILEQWFCIDCDLAITTDAPLTDTEKLVDFLYQDVESGENFFVEIDRSLYDTIEDALTAADEVASSIFDDWEYIGMYTYDEAEMLGYDTY